MKRVLLLLALLVAAPCAAFAQSNEIGFWVNRADFKPAQLDISHVSFPHRTGYGITYNRYFTPQFSAELGAQRMISNVREQIPGATNIAYGPLRTDVITAIAQWHFRPEGVIAPYAGVGAAYFTNGQPRQDKAPEFIRVWVMRDQVSVAAQAGLNIAVAPHIRLALDAKYAPYKVDQPATPVRTSGRIDPLTLGLGVRFRM